MITKLRLNEVFKYSKSLRSQLENTPATTSAIHAFDYQTPELIILNGIPQESPEICVFLKITVTAEQITLRSIHKSSQALKVQHQGTSSRHIIWELQHDLQLIEEILTNNTEITSTFNIDNNVHLRHNLLNAQATVSNRYLSENNLKNDAKYTSNILNIHCHNLQVICNINLNGNGASCHNYILQYANKNDNLDTLLLIAHNASHTSSHSHAHTIADQQATSSILGKIYVKANLIQIVGELQIKNLLCSPQASCNARPQLEIYSDDVKCAHGASTGNLSTEALYYLQSRGIDQALAKKLLLAAFIDNIMQHISILELKAYIHQLLDLSDTKDV